ncbi:MAG: tetratricopeptide repeat protein [Candidatus Heimdallarchaeota archaeon]
MSIVEVEEFHLALENMRNEKYQEAITSFDKIIRSSTNIQSVVTRDIFVVSEWEYINEISSIEKEIDKKIKSFDSYLALGLLYKFAQNGERRLKFLKKALELDSNNSRIWREYGETAFQSGNMRQALQYFQQAVDLQNNDSFSLEGIGLCYYYLDEPIKAISPLQQALIHDATNHCIMNHLAFIQSEIGEIKEAHDLIVKALKLDKKNNIYLDTYACILFLQEKYDKALKTFEKILKNNPKNWEISWDILTNLYHVLGLHVKAKQLEEKILL